MKQKTTKQTTDWIGGEEQNQVKENLKHETRSYRKKKNGVVRGPGFYSVLNPNYLWQVKKVSEATAFHVVEEDGERG